MLSSPPASLLPKYGRNRIRAGRRTKTQLKRVIQASVCLAQRPCQNQFIADSQREEYHDLRLFSVGSQSQVRLMRVLYP